MFRETIMKDIIFLVKINVRNLRMSIGNLDAINSLFFFVHQQVRYFYNTNFRQLLAPYLCTSSVYIPSLLDRIICSFYVYSCGKLCYKW